MLRTTFIPLAAAAFCVTVAVTSTQARQGQPPAQPRAGGWTIPPDAGQEKNPVAGDANAIAAGKELFGKKCQRCHGPHAKGDGPDADPDYQEDMDLTVARRAARNPDGVIFYKVWNGRGKPKMPSFRDELTKDQVWQIVSYVQTLRAKQ